MKDLQTILRRAQVLDAAGASYVLATVVQTSGSVYRGPGTRMLIEADLQSLGTISGGCLEGDVRENARQVFADGQPRLLHYDATSEDDILWGTGLGCSGTVDVLLERLPQDSPFHYPTFLREGCGVLGTVFSAEGDTCAALGQHAFARQGGHVCADIADAELRRAVLASAGELLATLDQTRRPVVLGCTRHYELAHGRASVLLEPLLPPIALHIFGAGYDAVPLARLAGELGWRVTVADHRPSYARAERFPWARQVFLAQPGHLPEDLQFDNRSCAVVMSHNYLQDQALLRNLLAAPLAYLGVLGPHQRTQRLLADLRKEGIAPSDEQTAHLFSPVGLDIGAETAEEIALSILGEIQAALTGRRGGSLRDHPGPIHDRSTAPG